MDLRALACLASRDAFLVAPAGEVASAVLVAGFASRLAEPQPRVLLPDIAGPIAHALGITDATPGSVRYLRAMNEPANAEVLSVVQEGVLVAEQRLCLVRTFDSDGWQQMTLLRRGRDALASGQPEKYFA